MDAPVDAPQRLEPQEAVVAHLRHDEADLVHVRDEEDGAVAGADGGHEIAEGVGRACDAAGQVRLDPGAHALLVAGNAGKFDQFAERIIHALEDTVSPTWFGSGSPSRG